MLKLVAIGFWIIAVTAGATFGSVYIAKSSGQTEAEEEPDLGVEELKSEMTSFPIMRNGGVTGYLILQLSFSTDRRLLAERKVDPLPYLMDAAFRVIFARTDVDFRRLRSRDLEQVTAAIATEANSRLGMELVRHVLVQQVNFVNKEDIRTNWINDDNGSQ